MGKKKKNRLKKFLIAVVVVVVAILIAFGIYIGKYYHAEVDVDNYLGHVENVTTIEMGQDIGEGKYVDGLWLDGTGTEDLIIFYPGAKVEYTSYLPLFYDLTAKGVDCYIVDMPGNLAFFGMDAAEWIINHTEGVYENYYLAGHSLGGAMGASFASDYIQTSDKLKGMIFLASYSTKSLDKEGFKVLSVYGSEDTVLNMGNLIEGREYMPENYTEVTIDGGNHAQFGNYGVQKGDGQATIDAETQQAQTVELILQMVE